jgi:TonB family protein
MVGEPSAEQMSATPASTTPTASPLSSPAPGEPLAGQSRGLPAEVKNVRPAVILVSIFDGSGKLLRTATAFFVTEDGKLLTNWRTVAGGAYAVAKMEDGAIYNVTGILASSTKLDLAVLKVDVKQVPFLQPGKTAKTDVGSRATVVGSALAGSEGAPVEGTIYTKQADHGGERLGIVAPIAASSIGSPVVDGNGQLIGIVTARNEQGEALDSIRSSSAVQSFLSQIAPDAAANWPATAQASPSPRPTPKLPGAAAAHGKTSHEPRLIYKPHPSYPFEARLHPSESRTGQFQLHFDASGNVADVQIVKSTGNDLLDSASTHALRQWKSEPGQEWTKTIPITFQNR